MKSFALVLLALLGLSGCASLGQSPDRQVVVYEVDYERMAIIDRAAARVGVQVVWINAPRKAVAASGG
jgi:uncharacterized protein YceK